MGHSLGALMQVLLCCVYADYSADCAGAALISYNNKPVSDAIPLFKEVFVPALSPLSPLASSAALGDAVSAVARLRADSFGVARTLSAFALNPLVLLGQAAGMDVVLEASEEADRALRDAQAVAALADQVPDVLGSVARGASEFSPSPDELRAQIGERYQLRSPLVVQFSDDSLDESPQLLETLPLEASAVSRRLRGTHLTPLALEPRLPLVRGGSPPGPLRETLLADVDALVDEVVAYFGEAVTAVAAGPPKVTVVEPLPEVRAKPSETRTPPPTMAVAAPSREVDVAAQAALRSLDVSYLGAAAADARAAAAAEMLAAEAAVRTRMVGESSAVEERATGVARTIDNVPPPTNEAVREASPAMNWKYEAWMSSRADGEAAAVALAAERAAKTKLEMASRERSAAAAKARVASAKAFVGSVVPTDGSARYRRLREVAEAKLAADDAAGAEEDAEMEARAAAVMARVAEIEASSAPQGASE